MAILNSSSYLNNATIVLTGATGGIGRAIATTLDKEGARLLLTGRDTSKLKELAAALHGKHQTIAADLGTTEGIEQFRQVCSERKDINTLINNVGINDFRFLEDMDPAVINDIIKTNLLIPIHLCQILLPQLQDQPKAKILNIGSTFGSIGFPGNSVYCASKFGLRGFTEALRRELHDSSIDVHYLSPRATKTALNNAAVDSLNSALNNAVDSPEIVAAKVVKQLNSHKGSDRFIGFPETLFAKINGVFPSLVTSSIAKNLPTIRKLSS